MKFSLARTLFLLKTTKTRNHEKEKEKQSKRSFKVR